MRRRNVPTAFPPTEVLSLEFPSLNWEVLLFVIYPAEEHMLPVRSH